MDVKISENAEAMDQCSSSEGIGSFGLFTLYPLMPLMPVLNMAGSVEHVTVGTD